MTVHLSASLFRDAASPWPELLFWGGWLYQRMTPQYNSKGIRPYTTEELKKHLWDKSHTEDKGYVTLCYIWDGLLDHKGYGKLTHNYRDRRVQQLGWELYRGPVPKGVCVLHHCDQPRCWRPDHLFLGSKADNNHDRDIKGRTCRGSDHHLSKLTKDKVLAIRRRSLTEPRRKLAEEFGVTVQTIRFVIIRHVWKHV